MAPAPASTDANRAPRPLEAPVTIATRFDEREHPEVNSIQLLSPSQAGVPRHGSANRVTFTQVQFNTWEEPMPVAVEVEPIQYEVDGHVARIWLNRPHKRNSVSQQLLEELDQARIRAEEDPDVRVMVIRGREGTFCSGFDLDELQGDFVGTYEGLRGRAALCPDLRRVLPLAEAVGERPRGLHDRRRVRDPDQLRLLDRRGDRQDRRLPHAARTVRRRRSDLSATADPRRAAGEGTDADGQAAHGSRSVRVGARAGGRARRGARPVRRRLRRAARRQEPVPDGDHEDEPSTAGSTPTSRR